MRAAARVCERAARRPCKPGLFASDFGLRASAPAGPDRAILPVLRSVRAEDESRSQAKSRRKKNKVPPHVDSLPLLPSGPGGVHEPALAGPQAWWPNNHQEHLTLHGEPAERAGFEPAEPFRAHTISSRAPSTARSPLQSHPSHCGTSALLSFGLAESAGFEPAVPFRGTLDFESSTFDHSDSSPRRKVSEEASVSIARLRSALGPQRTKEATQLLGATLG